MMETWKDIKDYEGYYQVSDFGNIRSLERTVHHSCGGTRLFKSRRLDPTIDSYGYEKVTLSKKGVAKKHSVHRLVAQAFLKDSNDKPQINHIDGIKTNNNAVNLEYCTSSANIKHAYELGLMKPTSPEKASYAKLKNKDVQLIRCWLKQGFKHKDIACKFNVTLASISNIRTGRTWSALT